MKLYWFLWTTLQSNQPVKLCSYNMSLMLKTSLTTEDICLGLGLKKKKKNSDIKLIFIWIFPYWLIHKSRDGSFNISILLFPWMPEALPLLISRDERGNLTISAGILSLQRKVFALRLPSNSLRLLKITQAAATFRYKVYTSVQRRRERWLLKPH